MVAPASVLEEEMDALISAEFCGNGTSNEDVIATNIDSNREERIMMVWYGTIVESQRSLVGSRNFVNGMYQQKTRTNPTFCFIKKGMVFNNKIYML